MSPLFDGWEPVFNVLLTAPLLYVAVVLFIRISGKRSTSKMNTFDWIVTVAIGSIVGSGVISQGVHLVTALVAIGILLFMQYLITKLSSHSPRFHNLVNATPTLVYFRGEFQERALHAERVAKAEIVTAARENGHASMESVEAVILEPDGDLSVLGQADVEVYATLDSVSGVPENVITSAA